MHRRVASLIALLLTLTGMTFVSLTAVSSGAAQAKDVDCSDFANQASAQNYFLNHGGPNSDPDGLDADGDGIACESNPCPCTTGGGGGGGGGGHPTTHKPPHKFTVRGHEIGNTNRFEILGKVFTLKNGRFQLQRKAGSSAFRTWKYVKTNRIGRFRSPIVEVGSKKTCYRMVMPETKHNRKTISKTIGCITTS